MKSMIARPLLVVVLAVSMTACGRVPVLTLLTSDYERTLDAYSQVDETDTDVSATIASDGSSAALLSAFYGLDDDLPRFSERFICTGSDRKDGMPVIFSHEVDVSTIEPGDFQVMTAAGRIGSVTCLTLAPADDPGELRTALLAGDFGDIHEQPVSVEIVGDLLTQDRSANFRGAKIEVTPLEPGPSIVIAELVPRDQWALGSEGTSLPFGGGDGCPLKTQQVIRVTWDGGVTKPGGDDADQEDGARYQVRVQSQDGSSLQIAPMALADLGDGDNNHKLCLDTDAPVISVTFPAGFLTDPREDLNPETSAQVDSYVPSN